MRKTNYEIDGFGFSTTQCKNFKHLRIGSITCLSKCKLLKEYNLKEKWVKCKFKIFRAIVATIFLSCSLSTIACGHGLIGLLEKDKHERLVMNDAYTLESKGHVFNIYVVGYYEPDVDCINIELTNVFWNELVVWMDGKLMKNGYIGPIQKSLHERYILLICGG